MFYLNTASRSASSLYSGGEFAMIQRCAGCFDYRVVKSLCYFVLLRRVWDTELVV